MRPRPETSCYLPLFGVTYCPSPGGLSGRVILGGTARPCAPAYLATSRKTAGPTSLAPRWKGGEAYMKKRILVLLTVAALMVVLATSVAPAYG